MPHYRHAICEECREETTIADYNVFLKSGAAHTMQLCTMCLEGMPHTYPHLIIEITEAS
jgi:hypothetical protein